MLTYSDIFKKLRNQLGLTQREFADKLGISFSYISKIESGNKLPGRELLDKVSEMFDISIDNVQESKIFFSKRTFKDFSHFFDEDVKKAIEKIDLDEILFETFYSKLDGLFKIENLYQTMNIKQKLNLIPTDGTDFEIEVELDDGRRVPILLSDIKRTILQEYKEAEINLDDQDILKKYRIMFGGKELTEGEIEKVINFIKFLKFEESNKTDDRSN